MKQKIEIRKKENKNGSKLKTERKGMGKERREMLQKGKGDKRTGGKGKQTRG